MRLFIYRDIKRHKYIEVNDTIHRLTEQFDAKILSNLEFLAGIETCMFNDSD